MNQNWKAAEGDDREVPKKGKAVIVEHYLFDELWNMGSRKLPDQVQLKLEGEENQDGEEEIKQTEEVKEPANQNEEEKKEEEESSSEPEPELTE